MTPLPTLDSLLGVLWKQGPAERCWRHGWEGSAMGADETGRAGPVPYAGLATLCVTFHGATLRSAEVSRVEET